MIFSLDSILNDPIGFLTTLLLYLPGIMLAISIHESAHGWVAEKCGDPTARLSGRITLNPVKHFDPMGFLMILIVGFGWAKPVPVNPLNYKHYRRDDVKVSLAGICANLMLFLLCFLILQTMFTVAIYKMPEYDVFSDSADIQSAIEENRAFKLNLSGTDGTFIYSGGIYDAEELYKTSSGLRGYLSESGEIVDGNDIVIAPSLGRLAYYVYRMITYCMYINLSLAVFNLIPLPPLDGYHVLNDLVLKQDLFAQRRTQQISSIVLLALIMLGNVKPEWDILSIAIRWVRTNTLDGLTYLSSSFASLIGVI